MNIPEELDERIKRLRRAVRVADLLMRASFAFAGVSAVLLALAYLTGCGGGSRKLPDVAVLYVNCHKGTCV